MKDKSQNLRVICWLGLAFGNIFGFLVFNQAELIAWSLGQTLAVFFLPILFIGINES